MSNEDIVIEPNEEEPQAKADAEETIKKLKEKLKKTEAEKAEYLAGWQKARADFVNLRKKDEEDKKSFVRFAAEDTLVSIIPVLDSFELAFANKEAWEKIDANWRTGVMYIYNQLKTTLAQQGLSEINPKIGEPFDINTSESTEHVETDKEIEDNTIARVVKKGYVFNDKIVRPAQVVVAEYKK